MFKIDNRKRGKAWPRHTPGRKETLAINLANRPVVMTQEERDAIPGRLIPLKRKYQTYRAYMQAPVGSPAAPRKAKNVYFPMSRNRAIPSPLADLNRPNR